MFDILFRCRGRINRAKFIIFSALIFAVTLVLHRILGPDNTRLFGVFVMALFYCRVCLFAKRLHDLNKSGLFSILALVPFVSFGLLGYCTFIKGTSGDNKYGSDPLNSNVLTNDFA